MSRGECFGVGCWRNPSVPSEEEVGRDWFGEIDENDNENEIEVSDGE